MRFDMLLQADGQGWSARLVAPHTDTDLVDPANGEPLLAAPRRLGRSGAGRSAFPLPDPEVLAAAPAGVPRALCAPAGDQVLPAALNDLLNQSGPANGVRDFGRYLFTVLLGEALWQRIDAMAARQPIELGLRWPGDDAVLNRLPWEALCSERGFLSEQAQVSITRRIDAVAPAIVASSERPCVLFVVGSPLSDRAIRPGAEYFGLLRSLSWDGLYLESHLLLNASLEKLQAAIKAFRPQIVHFICHGIAQGDEVKLQLLDDRNPRLTVEVACHALIENLRTDDGLPLPQAVVLNACGTATSDELATGRPFAAELVENGIPVVVGMSGQVADQACRMFSTGFYRALLKGDDVALAASAGRRAAISFGGYDPGSKIDWALPAIFLAGSVVDARLSTGAVAFAQTLHRAAAELAPPSYPGFCDRFELLQDFSLFMGSADSQRRAFGDAKLVFAASSPVADGASNEIYARYGRTWLLREIAAGAFRAGHLPLLMDRQMAGGRDWPTTPADLTRTLLRAAARSVDLLRTHGPFAALAWRISTTHSMTVLNWAAGTAPAPGQLPAEITDLSFDDADFSRRFATAFRHDMRELLATTRALYPEPLRANMRLLLLIDDVHRMGGGASTLLSSFLGGDGLAGAGCGDVRVVITYAQIATANQQGAIKVIDDWRGSTRGVVSVQLAAFSKEVQDFEKGDRLPYKQFLLSWHSPDPATSRMVPRPLTIASAERGNQALGYFFQNLADVSEGVPSSLASERGVGVLVRNGVGFILKEATDEDALSAEALRRRA